MGESGMDSPFFDIDWDFSIIKDKYLSFVLIFFWIISQLVEAK